MKNYTKQWLVFLTTALASNLAHANLITSAADLALAGSSNVSFESLATGNYAASIVQGNVTLSQQKSTLRVYDNSYISYAHVGISIASNPAELGNRMLGFNNTNVAGASYTYVANPLKISFAQSVSAFGFNYANDCSSVLLSAYDSENNLLEQHSLGFQRDMSKFYGISSTHNIAYALIEYPTGGYPSAISTGYIDNIHSVAAVPLPASWLLFMAGASLLGLTKKRWL